MTMSNNKDTERELSFTEAELDAVKGALNAALTNPYNAVEVERALYSARDKVTEARKHDFPMKKRTKQEMVPVLDTEEKLVEYASKFMHRPVSMAELRFEPFTLECVKLLCGRDALQDVITKMKELVDKNENEHPELSMLETLADFLGENALPTSLGIVDGVAADVINAWRAKQDEQ